MSNKENIHEGHRQRLKNRFNDSGLDNFEAHNILELLLFYSIPRKDTNEIAHNLLNHFGTLRGVFDAEFEELLNVNGIKENSATLIKLIPAIAREYISSKHGEKKRFDTAEKIGDFLIDKYFGETKEVVYAVLMNNNFEIIACEKIHEGTVNSAHVSARKIVDLYVKFNASMVVLAHNHPNGNVCPSMDDIETTRQLYSAFEAIDISLIEHFVVAGNDYCPIINTTDTLKYKNKDNRDFFRRSLFVKD